MLVLIELQKYLIKGTSRTPDTGNGGLCLYCRTEQ